MKKIITEGQMIPKFYGVAYLEIDRYAAVCYPVPINLLVGKARQIWFWLKSGNRFETGYDKGFLKGEAEGRKLGIELARTQTLRFEVNDIIKRFMETQQIEFRKPQLTAGWILDFVKKEEERLSK